MNLHTFPLWAAAPLGFALALITFELWPAGVLRLPWWVGYFIAASYLLPPVILGALAGNVFIGLGVLLGAICFWAWKITSVFGSVQTFAAIVYHFARERLRKERGGD